MNKLVKSRWLSSLRVFQHHNYRYFWIGQLVSLSGSWMQLIALNWLTYRLTGSPLMLGLINFVALLPVGLIALVGGVISDRFPRRKLILITQTVLAVQAFFLTLLAWFNLIEIWHIMVVTFLVSAMDVIEQPARFAFLLEIVGKEDFTSAVGLNSSMVSIARFVGPAIAGVFISEFGEASCFFVNFITYLIVIGAFALMDSPSKIISRPPLKLKNDLLEGLKYVWQNHTIKAVLGLIFIPVFLSQPYMTLLPVFARDVFHTGSQGYGWLVSMVGVGAVFGAFLSSTLQGDEYKKWLIRVALIFPISLLLFALSQQIVVGLALLLLVGASQLAQQVLANSSVQLAATEEFHGRVTSFFALFFNGLIRIGGVQVGVVAEFWGVSAAVASGALLSLIWVIAMIRYGSSFLR